MGYICDLPDDSTKVTWYEVIKRIDKDVSHTCKRVPDMPVGTVTWMKGGRIPDLGRERYVHPENNKYEANISFSYFRELGEVVVNEWVTILDIGHCRNNKSFPVSKSYLVERIENNSTGGYAYNQKINPDVVKGTCTSLSNVRRATFGEIEKAMKDVTLQVGDLCTFNKIGPCGSHYGEKVTIAKIDRGSSFTTFHVSDNKGTYSHRALTLLKRGVSQDEPKEAVVKEKPVFKYDIGSTVVFHVNGKSYEYKVQGNANHCDRSAPFGENGAIFNALGMSDSAERYRFADRFYLSKPAHGCWPVTTGSTVEVRLKELNALIEGLHQLCANTDRRLKQIKEEYPDGSSFISASGSGNRYMMDHDNITLKVNSDHTDVFSNGGIVVCNGQWAERVIVEKAPEKEVVEIENWRIDHQYYNNYIVLLSGITDVTVRTKALHNFRYAKDDLSDDPPTTISDALAYGFTWSETPEGSSYWGDIHLREVNKPTYVGKGIRQQMEDACEKTDGGPVFDVSEWDTSKMTPLGGYHSGVDPYLPKEPVRSVGRYQVDDDIKLPTFNK